MSQFHIGQEGCKATLIFNGKIDAEPTLTAVGSATMTQDPRVEVSTPATDDPDNFVETRVVLHFKNTGGQPAGMFGVTGTVQSDIDGTDETEAIAINYPEVGEYIPAAQAKANTVSLSTEIEPL